MNGGVENVGSAEGTGCIVANPLHKTFFMENVFTGTDLHILLIIILEVSEADGAFTVFCGFCKGDFGQCIVHEPIYDAVVPANHSFSNQQKQSHQGSPHNRVDIKQEVHAQVTTLSISLLLIMEQQFIICFSSHFMRCSLADHEDDGEDAEVEKSPNNLPVEILNGQESEERDEEDDVEKQKEMKAYGGRLLKFG